MKGPFLSMQEKVLLVECLAQIMVGDFLFSFYNDK